MKGSNSDTILLITGVAVLGVGAYLFYNSQQQQQAQQQQAQQQQTSGSSNILTQLIPLLGML